MKFKNALMIVTTVLILFVLACTPPPSEPTIDLTQVKKDVSGIAQSWQNAINTKDMEAQLALFADDMKTFGPNKAPETSKAAIKAAMEAAMAKDTANAYVHVEFTTNEVFAAGDLAVELGSWADKDEEGNVTDKGNYFTVLQKKDGKYVVVRDIWNSEMPVKKPEPMAEATE